MVAHLFLDFDGVVHRTATDQLRRSFGHVVRERLTIDDETVSGLFAALQALPSTPALSSFFDWVGVEDVPVAIARVHECYPDGWKDMPDAAGLDPGIVSLIRSARDAGVTVDILSSASPTGPRASAALDALAEFGVEWLATDGGSKADPDTYRRSAATKNAASPSQCVLVDDSIVAVAAAEKAGVRAYYSATADSGAGRNWRLDEIEDELFGRST